MNGRNHHHTPHRVIPRALCRACCVVVVGSSDLRKERRQQSIESIVCPQCARLTSGVGLTLTERETSVGRQRDVRLRNARRSVAQRKYNAIAEDPMAWRDGTP